MDTASRFAPDWLALREPVDHRSRARALVVRTKQYLRAAAPAPYAVVDLGAGSGSNFRYLAPRLDGDGHWRLVDHDPQLLALAAADPVAHGTVEAKQAHLSPLRPLLAGADLVTASALLDLASADWIAELCSCCARARAALFIALTIDGRVRFSEPQADDAAIARAVADDQRRDKGLGPALGGRAPAVLVDVLTAHGYAVDTERSDWHLDSRDRALACALIAGWRQAARRQMPAEDASIAAWARRRTAAICHGGQRLVVGHVDVLGLPGTPEKSRS